MSDAYNIVEQASTFPAMCAVSCDRDGPFVDLGVRLAESGGAWGYLHVSVAEKVGDAIGMVPKREVEVLEEVANDLADQVHELSQQVEALTTLRDLEAKVAA